MQLRDPCCGARSGNVKKLTPRSLAAGLFTAVGNLAERTVKAMVSTLSRAVIARSGGPGHKPCRVRGLVAKAAWKIQGELGFVELEAGKIIKVIAKAEVNHRAKYGLGPMPAIVALHERYELNKAAGWAQASKAKSQSL